MNDQNNRNNQNNQNTTYTYGNNMNAGAPNYYADNYTYNGQNTSYQGYQPELEEPVKMGEWLLILCLITFIPCVGLILAIVWAFSNTENKNKVNYCKAYLIVFLIQLVLTIAVMVVYGGLIFAAM